MSQQSLDQCERASNCELYDAPWGGKGIRFKKGMEPGTKAYNETHYGKRNGGALIPRDVNHANVEMGTNFINYGAINPYDVIASLWNPCQQYGCNGTPYKVGTAYVVPETAGGYWGTRKWNADLTLHVTGTYNGWAQRDALMKLFLQMAQTGQRWEQKSWEQWQWVSSNTGGYGTVISRGSQWEGIQTDWYIVNHYNVNGDLRDFMSLWFDLPTGERHGVGCDQVASVIKDVVGVLSGPLATIFGALVGIACGSNA